MNTTCPVCFNPKADLVPWEGIVRCSDHEECGRYLREVYMAPVTFIEHPHLAGLPEIAQDACARQGNPLLMVGGGSLSLSHLLHMMVGEGMAREAGKYRAILKRVASLHTQLVDSEGSINAAIAELLDEMPEETVECKQCKELVFESESVCPRCGLKR